MLAVAALSAPAEAAARVPQHRQLREPGSRPSSRTRRRRASRARRSSAALDGVTFDPAIIRRDSGQGVFQQSFLQFAGRMTAAGRYQNGLKQLKANAALLSRIEQRTGVPPPVVVALWGLESDYGAYKGGTYNIIRSVATLAYDCRRSAFFRDQLMGAVRIVRARRPQARADDRQLGRRARADAVHAGGLFQARHRFRRRRPRRHGPQRAGCARLRRQSAQELRLAEGPALAAGGARAGADAVGAVRARHPASALAMGEVGRHRRAWRPAPRRQPAGVADPADGPSRSGVPRLSELQGLHRMERRASSIRPPRPISARGSPAPRRSVRATASRWCRPRRRSRSCSSC